MIRPTISVMGKQTAYWERNPDEARTLVLLHGFRGNHKGLTDLAQHLAGFRLILPDLPGYGESEPLGVPHTLTHYAQWLDQFAAALDLKSWASCGHSYGGSIVLIQAVTGRRRPDAVVAMALAAVRQGWGSTLATAYYEAGRVLPPRLRQRWIADRLLDHAAGRWLFRTVTPKRRRELMRRGDRNLPELNPQVVTEEYLSTLRTDLAPYATAVKAPMLVIAGARDIIVPLGRVKRLVALMPHGTLVVMEDEGHLAPIEEPATTASIIKRFLAH